MSIGIEGLPETGRKFNFDPEPQINRADIGLGNQELWRKLQDQLNIIGFSVEEIHTFVSGGLIGMAYQEVTIAASDLTTTVVANDTLITESQTLIEFNWNDPRLEFARSVNLEPALGVEQMGFILDTAAHVNPTVLHRIADDGTVDHVLIMDCVSPGATNTHLIRRNWVSTLGVYDLDPVAWTVGQKLHLVQLRVLEATTL